MKVLIVSTNLSHPTDAGNRAAIMGQVQILDRLGCEVHFLYADMAIRQLDDSAMRNFWQNRYHVYHLPIPLKAKRLITDKIRKTFGHGYWSCDDHYPTGIEKFVGRLDKDLHFDAIIVQYIRLSKLLLNTAIHKKAIYTHDVFSYKDKRVGSPFYETCTAHEEAKALQRCPNIFAIQEEEATYFHFLAPQSKIYTVYNSYEFHRQPITNSKNLLYLASRMEFNVNGILKFLEEVWPSLLQLIPEIQLVIGGSVCEKIEGQKYSNVILMGRVESLDDFYQMGDIVINPVFQGTGLKIKTFEALSYGKTTIVHPHSMSGIFQKEEAPLLQAKTPNEWICTIQKIFAKEISLENQKKAAEQYILNMNSAIQAQYEQFLG